MRVGLVFGGRSVEHRVSIVSARSVAAGLEQGGHEVVAFGVARDGGWADEEVSRAALGAELDAIEESAAAASGMERLSSAAVEVAFPLVHGTWGEDGTLQGFFEILDLPYVGCGVTASAVAMDKRLAKQVLAAAGIPVVEDHAVSRSAWESDRAAVGAAVEPLGTPLFVKPSVGGSSVGVRKVRSARELEDAIDFALQFDDWVLVERGIDARELECSVLGYRRPAASAIGEVVPGGDFYDYADKYLNDLAGFELPAKLAGDLESRVRQTAVAAFEAIGGAGMARVDFLLDRGGDELYLNEINTIPGFTSISMYPKLWEISGLPLPALLTRLLEIAVRRHADRGELDRGISGWLETLADSD